ncbi:DUF3078 domain-containing protein [Fulvivirga lutea]|uniref:DUF3078 domain-containing protein n=1 Tax=Fulvivirga lutea TaxID=2810512 RepID=A0A974WGI5_9BACT|nr:DUF3078 domain-containing protein [Fulvivirga lutea]QSE97635.1 DUF3078 domain-containing protein [Fulvivirga lutea]
MNIIKSTIQLLTVFLFVGISANIYAQDQEPAPISRDSAWTTGGNAGFFFQQVGVDNWAGGGENAVAYGSEVNLFANKRRRSHTWFNSLQAGYGLVKIGDSGSRKNNDVLIVTSQYGRYLSKNWQLSGGIDFRTQFDDGFNYAGAADGTDTLISTFMAPGYLSPYIGASYKPNDAFSATISPLMNKITFVLDDDLADVGAYGVEPGDNIRSQAGWSVSSLFQKEIMKNVNLKSSLLLFAAYEEPEHIDVNFDLFLNFKVNEFITTNFALQAIYDHDVDIEDDDGNVGPRLQLRNVLNIGVTFNFGEKPKEE